MQKLLSSSKLGPKRYRNGKITKIIQKIQHGMSCYNIAFFKATLKFCTANKIFNVMLQLRAVSKIVVKIFGHIWLAKTKLHLPRIVY